MIRGTSWPVICELVIRGREDLDDDTIELFINKARN